MGAETANKEDGQIRLTYNSDANYAVSKRLILTADGAWLSLNKPPPHEAVPLLEGAGWCWEQHQCQKYSPASICTGDTEAGETAPPNLQNNYTSANALLHEQQLHSPATLQS